MNNQRNWWLIPFFVSENYDFLNIRGNICRYIVSYDYITLTVAKRKCISKTIKVLRRELKNLMNNNILIVKKVGNEKRYYFTDEIKNKSDDWLISIKLYNKYDNK